MKLFRNHITWLNSNLLGFGIASLFSDLTHEIVPLLLPTLIVQYVSSSKAPQYVGFITGVSTAAASFTMLLSGWLNDRLSNRKPLLLAGYGLNGLFVGLLCCVQSWYQIFILITLAWIGRGLVSAPRNAMIADSVDPRFYGRAFGFRQAMDSIGSVLGPLLVIFLTQWTPQSLFSLALVPGIAAFSAIALFVQEISHKTDDGNHINFAALPRTFYWFLSALFIFSIANFSKTLLILRMLNVGTSSSFTLTFTMITAFYILRNIVQAFTSYYMGALSDTFGRTMLLALGGFGAFGIMCLLLLWPGSSIGYLTTLFLLSGISAGTVTSLEKSISADLLPEQQRGMGYGIMLTVKSIGDLISNIAVGYLWSAFSPQSAFLYAASLSFLASMLLLTQKK